MTIPEFLEECKKLLKRVALSGCKVLSVETGHNLHEQEAQFSIRVQFDKATEPDVIVDEPKVT